MSDFFHVTPRLTALTNPQIEKVHTYSLKILSSTGIRVDSARARDLFARKIGAAAVHDDRVYILPEIVEQAIQSAPNIIDIYDRPGNRVFKLGADRTRFGIGVTNNGDCNGVADGHSRTVPTGTCNTHCESDRRLCVIGQPQHACQCCGE